ncbi:hypothetical protein [Candidatus Acidianus copahuensis]|uniref:hypothetical protein n=1 Tax=Candidatus Acidianus copahuensis TaxID=1160895 RepID=UPI001F3FD5A3|nr:hypothetical protein [Candidatus Acidianus copahuensis]
MDITINFLAGHLTQYDGQSKAILNFIKGLKQINIDSQVITLTSSIENDHIINLRGKLGLIHDFYTFMGNPLIFKKFSDYLNDDSIYIVANDDLVPIINLKRNGKMILWAQGVLGLIFFWKEFYRKQRIIRSIASLFTVKNVLAFSEAAKKYDMVLANSNTTAN